MTSGPTVWAPALGVVVTCLWAQSVPPLSHRVDLDRRAARSDLGRPLREVSGLAVTPDGRVFAHGDEEAVIHQLDPETGTEVKRFGVGPRPVRGDFEGIAVAGGRFFLLTSRGVLYEFREGLDRGWVPFRARDTGLASTCEAEGLAYDASLDALLVACKTVPRADRAFLVIHRIALSGTSEPLGALRVSLKALADFDVRERFQASGIEVTASGDSYVLVSARDEAIIEVSRDGSVRDARRMSARRHPQMEGVTILGNGSLLIADEARGGAARLTLYAPRRAGRDAR